MTLEWDGICPRCMEPELYAECQKIARLEPNHNNKTDVEKSALERAALLRMGPERINPITALHALGGGYVGTSGKRGGPNTGKGDS